MNGLIFHIPALLVGTKVEEVYAESRHRCRHFAAVLQKKGLDVFLKDGGLWNVKPGESSMKP